MDNKFGRKWEHVYKNCWRMKTPKGWLVKDWGEQEISLCFVPDDIHEWKLKDSELEKVQAEENNL